MPSYQFILKLHLVNHSSSTVRFYSKKSNQLLENIRQFAFKMDNEIWILNENCESNIESGTNEIFEAFSGLVSKTVHLSLKAVYEATKRPIENISTIIRFIM